MNNMTHYMFGTFWQIILAFKIIAVMEFLFYYLTSTSFKEVVSSEFY